MERPVECGQLHLRSLPLGPVVRRQARATKRPGIPVHHEKALGNEVAGRVHRPPDRGVPAAIDPDSEIAELLGLSGAGDYGFRLLRANHLDVKIRPVVGFAARGRATQEHGGDAVIADQVGERFLQEGRVSFPDCHRDPHRLVGMGVRDGPGFRGICCSEVSGHHTTKLQCEALEPRAQPTIMLPP